MEARAKLRKNGLGVTYPRRKTHEIFVGKPQRTRKRGGTEHSYVMNERTGQRMLG